MSFPTSPSALDSVLQDLEGRDWFEPEGEDELLGELMARNLPEVRGSSQLQKILSELPAPSKLTLRDLVSSTTGAPANQLLVYSVRPIEPSDLLRAFNLGGLVEASHGTSANNRIASLRNRHHRIAELMASNLSGAEISAMVGISQSRISILRSDPSFLELVQHYRNQNAEAHNDLVGRLGLLASDAAEVLHDRIDDRPDSIKTAELLELLKTAADRSGAGPTNRQINLNAQLPSELLDQARRMIREQEAPRLVRPEALERAPYAPGENGALIHSDLSKQSPPLADPAKASGSQQSQLGRMEHPSPPSAEGQDEDEGGSEEGPPL